LDEKKGWYFYKGNFGELELHIYPGETYHDYEGDRLIGVYNGVEGTIEGGIKNNKFVGVWANKGLEGAIEFVIDKKGIKGSWKKGYESGPMRGKWFGEFVEDSSTGEEYSKYLWPETPEQQNTDSQPENNSQPNVEARLTVHYFKIETSEVNSLACCIAALTRLMMLADNEVHEGEYGWMNNIINHFAAKGIPVGDVWDEVDRMMQIYEKLKQVSRVYESCMDEIKSGLNDEDKNFLLHAYSNICAADDKISFEEFEMLSYVVQKWYPGSIEQLRQNLIKSGIKLDFD